MKIVIMLLLPSIIFSQVVFEPSENEVYNFLSRLSQKGLIEYNDHIRPVSRSYIAEKLNEANKNYDNLTLIEKDELKFHNAEFAYELSEFLKSTQPNSLTSIASLNKPLVSAEENELTNLDEHASIVHIASSITGRWRTVNYFDDNFVFNFDPTLGYGSGTYINNDLDHFWFGGTAWGYINELFGYSTGFENHYVRGKNYQDKFTPEPGVQIIKNSNGIEYYNLHFNLNFNWEWGYATIAKEYMEWGYGKSGNLVLSKNAPSFPYFRINISPVGWLDFTYLHAWLTSDVLDSTRSFDTALPGRKRNVLRDKYYAFNTLTLRPFKNFSVSLGNSVIYSDKIEVLYLIPVMLFKVADFEKYRGSNSIGDNIQYFMNVSSRNHIPKTHVYSTFFVDEFSPDLAGVERNQFGFSFGSSAADFPLNNLTLTVEYTKIYPFVYRHYIQTQTYENSSNLMGHWMGHNADQFYTSLNYRFIRGLQLETWLHLIRKGEDGEFRVQYSLNVQPPFLFGLRKYYTIAGVELKYELFHQLNLKSRFIFNELSAETTSGGRNIAHKNELFFSVSYGF